MYINENNALFRLISYWTRVRVALSIKEGKIKPSVFLNKISYSGGSNKLYLAFRELGRALRTMYVLKYIGDFDLRKEVHAATCKSEEFNEYVNWIAFADDTIRSNHRIEHIVRLGKYEMDIENTGNQKDTDWNFGLDYKMAEELVI